MQSGPRVPLSLALFPTQRFNGAARKNQIQIILGSKHCLTNMSGFRSSKQFISFSLKPKNTVFSFSERHPSTIFHHHLPRLARRVPCIRTVDQRRRVSVVSRPPNMAVGLLPPKSSQAPLITRAQFQPEQFHGLVQTLKEALGPSSGLDSNDVDLPALMTAMRGYDAKERGWVSYAFADPDVAYTRNLVDEGNGKSNLVRLCSHHVVET